MSKMKTLFQYAVLVLYFAFLDGVKFRCDYRYTYLGWFKYHEIPATWYDARLQCKLEGGILASPTTAAIKSFMLESFCKPEIFTGIHATFSKGQFSSIDGIPLAEIPHEWAPLEPDNKNNDESCLALNSDGKLADVRCNEPLPYICYREHSNIDVTVCGTPDPEYHFEGKTNKCYKLHTNARKFERAYFACSAEGGHLAVINSDEEANIIRQIFKKHPQSTMPPGRYEKFFAFIGFHNWGESVDWTTIHGQSIQDAGYAKFAGGQPDNTTTGEYCGSVTPHGLFNDMLCERPSIFICEKRPDYPAVCDNISGQNILKHVRVCDDDVQGQGRQLDIDPRMSDSLTNVGSVY